MRNQKKQEPYFSYLGKPIIKIKGAKPGKTVAVFAGIHGNEKAGVIALADAIRKLKITSGLVYFVFANPRAIRKNVRYINKNLNRCFLIKNKGKSYEDELAKRLMRILDGCDALLDLHASNIKKSTPFIICEKEAYPIAKKLDFKIVSSGWDVLEPGATDGYMHQRKKPALCLECGSVYKSYNNSVLAEKSIYQFLYYFGLIKKITPYNRRQQKFILAQKVAHKKTENFHFKKEFADFEKLRPRQIFAQDGETTYRAGKNKYIIFPNPNKKIGEEVFIIGKLVKD